MHVNQNLWHAKQSLGMQQGTHIVRAHAYSSVMLVSPASAAGCSAETPEHAKTKVTTNNSEALLGAIYAACAKPSDMSHHCMLACHTKPSPISRVTSEIEVLSTEMWLRIPANLYPCNFFLKKLLEPNIGLR